MQNGKPRHHPPPPAVPFSDGAQRDGSWNGGQGSLVDRSSGLVGPGLGRLGWKTGLPHCCWLRGNPHARPSSRPPPTLLFLPSFLHIFCTEMDVYKPPRAFTRKKREGGGCCRRASRLTRLERSQHIPRLPSAVCSSARATRDVQDLRCWVLRTSLHPLVDACQGCSRPVFRCPGRAQGLLSSQAPGRLEHQDSGTPLLGRLSTPGTPTGLPSIGSRVRVQQHVLKPHPQATLGSVSLTSIPAEPRRGRREEGSEAEDSFDAVENSQNAPQKMADRKKAQTGKPAGANPRL